MPFHVMVDLETLSIGPDAAILSIGAVKFDPYDAEIPLDAFYQAVDAASSQQAGLKISATTVQWWLHPSQDEARKKYMSERHTDLFSALDGFEEWYGDAKPLWGNGAGFDNVILRHAFQSVGLVPPWSFRDDRCYRTLKALCPDIKAPLPDVAHHALGDAVAQAKHLQAIFQHLGLRNGEQPTP